MNILVNIIFTTILISVVGAHTKSIGPWKKQHSKFNTNIKTKSRTIMFDFIKSQKGQTTPVGLFSTFVISVVIIIQLFFFLKNFCGARARVNTYLCTKLNIVEVKNSIRIIGKLNRSIVVANGLMVFPETFHTGQAIKRYSSWAQEGVYISFLKKFSLHKYCASRNSLSWVKSFPYNLNANFLLKRDALGLASPKEKEWSFYNYATLPKISYEQSFVLKTNYSPFLSLATTTKIHNVEL